MSARATVALTHFAEVERFRLAVERAAPRAAILYATGEHLDGGTHPTARAARELAAAGVVTLHGPNTAEWGRGRFVAVKCAPADDEPPAPGGPVLTRDERRVLKVIEAARAAGRDLPSHAEMARIVGLRSRAQARHMLARLRKKGVLE